MVGSLEAAIEKFEEVCNVKLNRKDDIRNAIWRLTDAVASLYREEESEYLTNYAFWITLDHYKMKKNGMMRLLCFHLKIWKLQLLQSIMRL